MTVILLLNAFTGAWFYFLVDVVLKELPNSFKVNLKVLECAIVLCITTVYLMMLITAFVSFVFS